MVDANIKVVSFDEDGTIIFQIDVSDCQDSAGIFSYEYTFVSDDEIERKLEQNSSWLRTHNVSTISVTEELSLGSSNKLVDVALLHGTINVDCFDGGENNITPLLDFAIEDDPHCTYFVKNNAAIDPLDIETELRKIVEPRVQEWLRQNPPRPPYLPVPAVRLDINYDAQADTIEYGLIRTGVQQNVERETIYFWNESKQPRKTGRKITAKTTVGATSELTRTVKRDTAISGKFTIGIVSIDAKYSVEITDFSKRISTSNQEITITEDREFDVSEMVAFSATLSIRKRRDSQEFKAHILVISGEIIAWIPSVAAGAPLKMPLPLRDFIQSDSEIIFSLEGIFSNIQVIDSNIRIVEKPIHEGDSPPPEYL